MWSNILLLLVIINNDSLAVSKKFNTQRNIFNEKISNILENASYKNTKANKNICVFTVTCQKNLGSDGRHSFFFF